MSVEVYGLCQSDGELRYVGVSNNPRQRLARHRRDARAGSALPVHRWIRKRGVPSLRVLATCASYEAAYERERELVAELSKNGRLVNIASGGRGSDGTKGRSLTKAHREAIARAMRGRVQSPATRRRIAEASRGRKHSTESRAAMSRAQRGKKRGPLTPEHRRKLSVAHLGQKPVPYTPESKDKLRASLRAAWARRRANGTATSSAATRAKISAGVKAHRARQREVVGA